MSWPFSTLSFSNIERRPWIEKGWVKTGKENRKKTGRRRQGLFQTFCGWTTSRRSSISCCRYGVQLPTEKTPGVMYSPHARHVGSQVHQSGLLWLVKTTTTTNNHWRCDTISPAVYNIPPFFYLTTTTKSWRFWKTIKPSVLKVMGSLLTCYKFSFTGFLTCRPLCVKYGAEPLPSDLSRTAAGPFLVSPSVIVGSWSSLKTSPEEDCGAVSVSGVSDICSGSGCWSVLALRRR